MYGSWDMKCNRHNFLSSCAIFCPFTPLTAWKMKISKMKKKPGDIILHKCTKNPDHRLYFSWDKTCDGCNCYFHFGLYFSLLLPPAPNSPKNENFKTTKKNIWRSSKKSLLILSFYTIVPKIMIICYIYCSWDMASVRCNCYFSFWAIFCPFTPQRIKILKNWKQILEISSFYKSVPKIMILCYTVPEIWHVTNVFFFHFGLFLALLPC